MYQATKSAILAAVNARESEFDNATGADKARILFECNVMAESAGERVDHFDPLLVEHGFSPMEDGEAGSLALV